MLSVAIIAIIIGVPYLKSRPRNQSQQLSTAGGLRPLLTAVLVVGIAAVLAQEVADVLGHVMNEVPTSDRCNMGEEDGVCHHPSHDWMTCCYWQWES